MTSVNSESSVFDQHEVILSTDLSFKRFLFGLHLDTLGMFVVAVSHM